MAKCFFKCGRKANSQHAKDYNHNNIDVTGNRARTCEWCHLAFHQLNHKNNLEWDWMVKNKSEEIVKLANDLKKRGVKII